LSTLEIGEWEMKKDKQWQRATSIGQAELLEFRRYIENDGLKRDVSKIRAEVSLPLSLNSNKVFFEDPLYIEWMGWGEVDKTKKNQKENRRKKVANKVSRMLRKYEIPKHFFGSLFNFVVTGQNTHTFQTKGFPNFIHGPHNIEGYAGWEYLCIITPETDLENPLVLENIKDWQRVHRNRPPSPIKVGRKKDWRPVWEWRSRNPSISDKQIAEMLNLNRVTVTRALNQLDKKHATK
jgi:hypothetical protein